MKTLHDFHEIRKKGWRFACRPGFLYCFPLAKWSFGAPVLLTYLETAHPHPRARSPSCFALITITTIGAYTRGFIFIPLVYERDSESPGESVQNWSASKLQGDRVRNNNLNSAELGPHIFSTIISLLSPEGGAMLLIRKYAANFGVP